MPVSIPSRASIETVNAVSYGVWLCETISRNPSSSHRSGVSVRQISPRPWVAMKLIASGVTSSAAMQRSPSFSRSGESQTTTSSPRATAAMASSIGQNGELDFVRRVQEGSQWGVPWRSCYQRPFQGRRRSTYLAITSTSRLTGSPTSRSETVVDVHVCGISAISIPSSRSAATVRLIPATATEPFSAT